MAEKPRPEKVAVVDEVRGRLSSSSAALLTEYRGLDVRALAALRIAVRNAGGEYKIYKNTLVRLAVRDLELEELEQLLTGPTAIAFVDGDAVVVAKSLRDFARTNPNLVIKGGILGRSVLSAVDAGALADVAPRDVLLAQFAGALAAPLRQMAGLLAALPRNFAYGLKALIDQKGAGAGAAAPGNTAGAAAPEDTAGAAAPEDTEAGGPPDDTAGAPVATADTTADTPPADASETKE
jgi:large subunit ribosomal protein L10